MIRRFPSVFLLIFVVSGILLADMCRLPRWSFLAMAMLCCAGGLAILGRDLRAWAAALFGMSLLFFGAFSFSLRHYDTARGHVSDFVGDGSSYRIYGLVTDWPDLKADRTEIKIRVDSLVGLQAHRVSGEVMLRISDTATQFQRGDYVEFYGQMQPIANRGFSSSFNYGRYLNLKGVFGIVYLTTAYDIRVDKRNAYGVYGFIDGLRKSMVECLNGTLSPEGAALASGFLIGETRNIPPGIYSHFRDSGTLHLLAVSGSNVAIVVLFLVLLMRPIAISPRRRNIVLILAVAVFTLLSYGEPSVVRASLMASLVIIAGLLERRYDLNNIIALAAVIILLFEPGQLFDVGFQLSFVIAWGLIFIIPRVTSHLKAHKHQWWYQWIILPLLVSSIAQICAAGLTAFYFQQIPLVSPLANLVVVPLVSVAVVGVLILLPAYLILPVLGAFVGAWLDLLLRTIMFFVNTFGSESIPKVQVVDLSGWTVVLFYAFLVMAAYAIQNRSWRRYVVVSLVIVVNLGFLAEVQAKIFHRDQKEIIVLNIPGGIAGIIRTPFHSQSDLVITGVAPRKYPVLERTVEPHLQSLSVEKIDALFVLSAEFDAVDDLLRFAERYEVSRIYIDSRYEMMLRDQMARNNVRAGRFEMIVFGGDQVEAKDEGLYVSQYGLLASIEETRVLFCDRLTSEHAGLMESSSPQTIVAHKMWQISQACLDKIQALGVERIFCSNFAQGSSLSELAEEDGQLQDISGLLYDLGHIGPVQIATEKR